MASYHTPVLLEEVISGLNLSPHDNVIDGTLGGGGHARALLAAIAPGGILMAFDRDPTVISCGQEDLKKFRSRLILINDSYSQLETHAQCNQFNNVAGVLLDLGFSSTQLADQTRGFSFQINGVLDLRYNPKQGISAAELLNTASQIELEQIFKNGEEPAGRRLGQAIIERRRLRPFATTADLIEVVYKIKGRGRRSLHPATLVWQALRLAVNNELTELKAGLTAAIKVLRTGGRLAVISFHSGEDRLVKSYMRQAARLCLCPPIWPECRCGHKPSLKLVSRKPILPQPEEIVLNPRAGSAHLRLAEKI